MVPTVPTCGTNRADCRYHVWPSSGTKTSYYSRDEKIASLDVDKLKEAEPWLFEAGGKHAKGGNAGGSGTTGLPNAEAASEEGKTLKH